VLSPDHPDALASVSNLSSALWNMSQQEEAKKLAVQVVQGREISLGIDHLGTQTSFNNPATMLGYDCGWEELENL
jgi:hypothetical protein